ncbi:MAG: hypothetical protein D6707_10180, partial [Bacteroidetes bacterium]
GLGPAASKVYFSNTGLSIAGYGEVVYNNYTEGNKADMGDAYRFIPYIGYKFSDKILFNSEIEFEHAGFNNVTDKEVEVYTEFMYLDFMLHRNFNIRSGLILMPASLFNEYHEPTVYYGTSRPMVEKTIVPSTWRELGVMAYGEIMPNINYKLVIANGLRSDNMKDWIKNGRQKGGKANFEKLSYLARLSYNNNGIIIGSSYYYGEAVAGIGGKTLPDTRMYGTVNLINGDVQIDKNGFHFKASGAYGTASGDQDFEAANISKSVYGYYVETAYNLMKHIKPASVSILSPYVRYTQYDLNAEVFENKTKDPSKVREAITAGVQFYPHPLVVLKADYMWNDTASDKPVTEDSGKIDQFNLSLGFIF